MRWPVAPPENEVTALTALPVPFYNENSYMNYYRINGVGALNYHTGIDIVFAPSLNRSAYGQSIYAVADGEIIFSGLGRYTSWGWIIIQKCDGFYVRYAHVLHTSVPAIQKGAIVVEGQQIAAIGNADGYYSMMGSHLHWDISTTQILATDPSDWPGADIARVKRDYVDPIRFTVDRKAGLPLPILTNTITTANLIIRAAPSQGSADTLKRVPMNSLVQVEDYAAGNIYCKLADGRGYVARAYLMPVVSTPMQVTAVPSLNRRAGPGTSYPVIGSIPFGATVNVWSGYTPDEFVMLDNMVGWASTSYLSPVSVPIPLPVIESIIDISHNNPVNDPAALRKAISAGQVTFIIHKVTEGDGSDNWIDSTYFADKAAYGPSVLWAAYHFLNGDDPTKQAQNFLNVVKPDGTFGLIFDLERNGTNTATATQAEIFSAYIEQQTGVKPWQYTGLNQIVIPADSPLKQNKLWFANEQVPPKLVPSPWTLADVVLQQFKQRLMPGFGNPIGINRFVGTSSQLNAAHKAICGKISSTVPPVDNAPNIPPTRTRIGLHIASKAPGQMLIDMAKRLHDAGKPLACVTVLSDSGLANKLTDYTDVMYRLVVGRGAPDEPYGKLTYEGLDATGAEKMGYNFYHGVHYASTQQLSKRVYIKLRNETYFHPLDCYFEIGAMKAAEEEDRRLAIFGDSMSYPAIKDWQQRIPALRYAMAHGHAVTLNQYGAYKHIGNEWLPGDTPVSADEGYSWYGEHPFNLYASVPPDCRPLLILGETGASDSTIFRGANFVIADMKRFDEKTRQYPYLLGWCYWSAGEWIGHPNASLDSALGAIESLVMSVG